MVKTIPAIPAVTDFESQGKRLSDRIYVLDENDVNYGTLPTITETDTARTMGALTLKSDAEGWKEQRAAKYTAAATSEGSAGDITSTNNHELSYTVGGESLAIDNYVQTVGRRVFICVIDRFTQKKTIYGRPYSPMIFSSFSKRKNGDNTSCDLKYTQESLFQPLEYLGEVVPSAPEPEDGGDGDE